MWSMQSQFQAMTAGACGTSTWPKFGFNLDYLVIAGGGGCRGTIAGGGGAGYVAGSPGGSLTGGGGGGGPGGGSASGGSPGQGPGSVHAIVMNGNTITYTNPGTITGGVNP